LSLCRVAAVAIEQDTVPAGAIILLMTQPSPKPAGGSSMARWALPMLLLLLVRPLQAHAFTTIIAESVLSGDGLTMDLELHLQDVVAILDGRSDPGSVLAHGRLVDDLPELAGYLEHSITVTASGTICPGRCLGYIPDLQADGHPPAADEPVPERLGFRLSWRLPRDPQGISVDFQVMRELVPNGMIVASLTSGASRWKSCVDLGRRVDFPVAEAEPGQPAAAHADQPSVARRRAVPGFAILASVVATAFLALTVARGIAKRAKRAAP
jgi:hypothetical protein